MENLAEAGENTIDRMNGMGGMNAVGGMNGMRGWNGGGIGTMIIFLI